MSKKLLFCVLFSLALFYLPSFIAAQPNVRDTEAAIWRTKSEVLTEALLKGSSQLGEPDRALILVKIGEEWWKSDPEQADRYIEKGVDTVFFFTPDAKQKDVNFFDKTRQILAIVSKYNSKQAARLVRILSNLNDSSVHDQNANASSLVDYALLLVKDDPSQAAQLGVAALRLGHPRNIYKLIWELRGIAPPLATKLFRETLSVAKASPSYDILQVVHLAAVPEGQISNFPEKLNASRREKIDALNFLADNLLLLQIKFKSKAIPSCANEASLMLRSKTALDVHVPHRSGPLQQAIESCLNLRSNDSVESHLAESKGSTIEELIALADGQKDKPILRLMYLAKAAILANQQKKYRFVVNIYDSLTSDEIGNDREFWDSMRSDASGNLAYLSYLENDTAEALRILEQTPVHIRPVAQTVFILLFPARDPSSLAFQMNVIDEARKGFNKSEMPFQLKSPNWFKLIRILSERGADKEASDTFREIVTAFNTFLTERPSERVKLDYESAARNFTPSLIESFDRTLSDTALTIADPDSRANVALALLRTALKKYESIIVDKKKNSPEPDFA